MKIRQGFVSNSSSSSFIAVGIEADDIHFPETWTDKEKEEFNEDSEMEWNGYIGRSIAYGVEDYGRESVSLEDILEYKKEVILELNKKGVIFKEEDIKLLYGNKEG